MNEWWQALETFEKIFWYIAIPFSVVLIIQMFMTFAGMGGSDVDAGGGMTDVSGLDLEGDIDISDMDTISHEGGDYNFSDSDPTFHFFSVRNFIAFFTIFGWAGIAGINEGLSHIWTILLAFALGIIAMLIISLLFYYISKLTASGNLDIRNALAKIGTVYLPIKAKSENIGKVQITVQDSLKEHDAITKKDEYLPTGTVVKVTGIVSGRILVVEKFNK